MKTSTDSSRTDTAAIRAHDDSDDKAERRRRLTRATQWALITLWPAGGQSTSRSNALNGSPDDGYAGDERSLPAR